MDLPQKRKIQKFNFTGGLLFLMLFSSMNSPEDKNRDINFNKVNSGNEHFQKNEKKIDKSNIDQKTSDENKIPGTVLTFSSVQGPLTIDGKPDEQLWESVSTFRLANPENAPLATTGGEARIAVRGDYLILSVRMPESNPVVAGVTGVNAMPSRGSWLLPWMGDDILVWSICSRSPIAGSLKIFSLTINPLGAYSLRGMRGSLTSKFRRFPLGEVDAPMDWTDDILIAAAIGKGEWSVEAALPLEQLDTIGYSWIERVRVRRPDMPELSWTWPAPNEWTYFSLPTGNSQPPPALNPPPLPDNTAKAVIMPPADSFEAEVSVMPKQAWTEKERQLLGTEEMLENFLKVHMAEYARQEKLA